MEVFVRNLPNSITETQVRRYFGPHLAKLEINTFHCQVIKGRGLATLTILDVDRGQKFLLLHGQTNPGRGGFDKVQQKLYHMRRPVNCLGSNRLPDRFLLQSMRKEEYEKIHASRTQKSKRLERGPRDLQREFSISESLCGRWDYIGRRLAFFSHFEERRAGRLIFGRRALTIHLNRVYPIIPAHQLEIPYKSIVTMTTGNQGNATITFSLAEAPKMYEDLSEPDDPDVLVNLMKKLEFQNRQSKIKRKRIMAINKSHEVVVSSCLCYRFVFSQSSEILRVQALKRMSEIPQSISWDTTVVTELKFPAQMTLLNSALGGPKYSNVPFEVKFQLQMLAQNGYLPPPKVLEFIKVIARYLPDVTHSVITAAIRRLGNQIPYAGPGAESSELSLEHLSDLLRDNIRSIIRERAYSADIAEVYDHIAPIHKAMVTPAGIYLSGPEPEVKNRVLRKYSAFSNYFLQVSFLEEDGEQIWYGRETSNDEIYHVRFKKVLEGVINIAGRGYEFLGFSHSSLRSQTCWFMAPFVLNGVLTYARLVVKDLGDFSLIHSPAKCAARIGQAFSQTFSSVILPQEAFKKMPDIERNGRVFSDGVGTCSMVVLQKIWDAYAQSRTLKPTLLQIRFAGAKGMISLDNRLDGESLCLRPSMIKFEGSNATDIEICGAGFKPLPMYLNRQVIKILEDLGVPDEAFLKLQAEAVESLRITASSPINAAYFLKRNLVGKAAGLSTLIRRLYYLGYDYGNDDFLRNIVELAILIQLREIKHRSRIIVENGMTLYGIMDETGFLQEGQIYCSAQHGDQNVPSILTGSVVITRCPALHPGDVRVVTAVDALPNSPLRALHNCVVFSSQGERDLPSQLSGGDLDGDLYNIIYDSSLYPNKEVDPADYPIAKPIDIGREVTRSDMTDFFIQFMENDALGRISTLHQTLADQKDNGTLDPDCIQLAEMASTAVDFSKTGIPVSQPLFYEGHSAHPEYPGRSFLDAKTLQCEARLSSTWSSCAHRESYRNGRNGAR